MRMLILPVALLLGAALHTLLPTLRERIDGGLSSLLAIVMQRFTTRRGRTDGKSALAVYLLALAAAAILLCAVHPLAAVLTMAPLFSGFRVLVKATSAKAQLDSGAYAKDRARYEQRVLEACQPLGDAFSLSVAVPMLLCSVGLALHLGSALAWVYAGLCAARADFPAVRKLLDPIDRLCDGLLVALLCLCAGLVGRNPLRIGGRGAGEKLMHMLSLESETDHAPIAGDITQGAFLCCLCAGLLCALLTGFGALIA